MLWPKRFLVYCQGPLRQRERLGVVSLLAIESGQGAKHCGKLTIVFPKELFLYLQAALPQVDCLVPVTNSFADHCHRTQAGDYGRVLASKRLLSDCQPALASEQCRPIVGLEYMNLGNVIEDRGNAKMIRSVSLYRYAQGPLVHGKSSRIISFLFVDLRCIVQQRS
jgi:hypothetical protein